MPLDSTHPARKFEGTFHLESWAAPVIPVPGSHADTMNLLKRLTGGKATLTLNLGAEYRSGIRLDGELESGGSTYTLYGSFIDPAHPRDAAGTLVILKPRQQVRFRASVTERGKDANLTLTPGFDDGADRWVQAFYFARQTVAPAASRAPAPPPAPRGVPAAPPENPDEILVKQWTSELAGTVLVYETNWSDSDYSRGSTYYQRRTVIKLTAGKIFELNDESFSRISTAVRDSSGPTRTRKVGFWRIAVSTKDQPLLVLKPTGEDEMLYVISLRGRTLNLDGKPWERTKL